MTKRLANMTKVELDDLMELLGNVTETFLPAGELYALVVFDSETKTSNYVGNIDRAYAIRLLRAQADAMEALCTP